MAWTQEETTFLIENYPFKGREYCATILCKSLSSIRMKTFRLGLSQNTNSDFFKDWQGRAAKSKVGKKRPDQAFVLKRIQKMGKLIKTEEQKIAVGVRSKKWIKENGHPKGMLGKKHTEETKKKFSVLSKARWEKMPENQKIIRNKKMIETRIKNNNYSSIRKKCTWKSGWREIGLIKKYYRSKWEANYARYLEWLKNINEIKDWFHESDVFWFEGIKRGCLSYLPDFKVIKNDDSIEFHEVKGWMDDRSKTKINRMKKYHPNITLIIIREKNYNEIKNKVSQLIKGWE